MAKVKSPDRPQGEPLASHDRPLERAPKAGAATDEPIVLDNLPEVIPVTAPELEVIETYLGNLIDRMLLDAAASSGAVTPISMPNPGKPARASRPRS